MQTGGFMIVPNQPTESKPSFQGFLQKSREDVQANTGEYERQVLGFAEGAAKAVLQSLREKLNAVSSREKESIQTRGLTLHVDVSQLPLFTQLPELHPSQKMEHLARALHQLPEFHTFTVIDLDPSKRPFKAQVDKQLGDRARSFIVTNFPAGTGRDESAFDLQAANTAAELLVPFNSLSEPKYLIRLSTGPNNYGPDFDFPIKSENTLTPVVPIRRLS